VEPYEEPLWFTWATLVDVGLAHISPISCDKSGIDDFQIFATFPPVWDLSYLKVQSPPLPASRAASDLKANSSPN
jgi:hypothetical protein